MSDATYRRLAELGTRRQELEEQVNKIRDQLTEVDRLLREAAALLLSQSSAGNPVVHEDKFDDIQPRQRELLRLIKRDSSLTQGELAMVMYKRNDDASRRSISAYFSRLRAAGYVEAVGRGAFKLTERGEAAAKEAL